MEARIARLESDVAHISTDVAEIKVDLRSLRDRTDRWFAHLDAKIDGAVTRLDARVDDSFTRLDAKIDSSVGELRGYCVSQFNAIDGKFERVLDSIATAKVWALTLYIALAVAMVGTMARGFGWL